MKLLVRATNWLGDAVMSLPALRAIRQCHHGDEIAVLAKPSVAELFSRENLCNEVILYEGGRFRVAVELHRRRFDCAILLQNAFDAALLAWIAGIPRRIGYARDGRSLLLTDAIPVPELGAIPRHQRFYYLELLRRAGVIDRLPECEEIRLQGNAAAGRELFRCLGIRGECVVGVSPGAAFGSAKQWLPERFADVASSLAADWGAEVAVFGASAEAELCASVAAAIEPRALNLAGRTSLGEFIDLAAACSAFVTNDSGAMHIASAVGVPTVVIFGPTDHEATGPCSSLARIVRTPVECSPCGLRECPIDHRCMTRVEAATVVAEAHRLVALSVHGHADQNH